MGKLSRHYLVTQHKAAFTSIVRLELIAQESPLSVCKMSTAQTNDKLERNLQLKLKSDSFSQKRRGALEGAGLLQLTVSTWEENAFVYIAELLTKFLGQKRMNCRKGLWEVVFSVFFYFPFFHLQVGVQNLLLRRGLKSIHILCRSNTYLMTANPLTAVATANNYPNNLHFTCCMMYDCMTDFTETQAITIAELLLTMKI